jgi:hypothetical protein
LFSLTRKSLIIGRGKTLRANLLENRPLLAPFLALANEDISGTYKLVVEQRKIVETSETVPVPNPLGYITYGKSGWPRRARGFIPFQWRYLLPMTA